MALLCVLRNIVLKRGRKHITFVLFCKIWMDILDLVQIFEIFGTNFNNFFYVTLEIKLFGFLRKRNFWSTTSASSPPHCRAATSRWPSRSPLSSWYDFQLAGKYLEGSWSLWGLCRREAGVGEHLQQVAVGIVAELVGGVRVERKDGAGTYSCCRWQPRLGQEVWKPPAASNTSRTGRGVLRACSLPMTSQIRACFRIPPASKAKRWTLPAIRCSASCWIRPATLNFVPTLTRRCCGLGAMSGCCRRHHRQCRRCRHRRRHRHRRSESSRCCACRRSDCCWCRAEIFRMYRRRSGSCPLTSLRSGPPTRSRSSCPRCRPERGCTSSFVWKSKLLIS